MAVMVFNFARVSAALAMKDEDYHYPSRDQRPWPSFNGRVSGLASLGVGFCPFATAWPT
jgi:hypothetical protein